PAGGGRRARELLPGGAADPRLAPGRLPDLWPGRHVLPAGGPPRRAPRPPRRPGGRREAGAAGRPGRLALVRVRLSRVRWGRRRTRRGRARRQLPGRVVGAGAVDPVAPPAAS